MFACSLFMQKCTRVKEQISQNQNASDMIWCQLEAEVVVGVFCGDAPPQQEFNVGSPVRVWVDVHVRVLLLAKEKNSAAKCAG